MDIAVLGGGRSPEHDISTLSARMVIRHLDRRKFRVWPCFLDKDGGFWPQRRPLAADEEWLPGDRSTSHGPLRGGTAIDWLVECAGVSMVFPALHGPFGEDGTLQGMLELLRVPFVGSGCLASALAMHKSRTRQVLLAHGIRMAKAYVPERTLAACEPEAEFLRLEQAIGLPAFCKADCSGSSRGIARVETLAEFTEFVASTKTTFARWFAEGAVRGEEITVPVLGNAGSDLQALPPVGIYPRFAAHFDERAKYEKGACDEIAPPPGWDPDKIRLVQSVALRCHEALSCDGMSRTDMIFGDDGPVVLEVNTIPGLTEASLLPKSSKAAGMTLTDLLSRLVDLAALRHGTTTPPMPAAPRHTQAAAVAVEESRGRP